MFFDGDLQEGIALALQEGKLVACFVKDSGAESSLWEDEYLKEPSVSQSLTEKAVTLRLDVASQEAKYLAAYVPVGTAPTLVIIRDGRLVLALPAGSSKNSFKNNILTTLTVDESSSADVSGPQGPASDLTSSSTADSSSTHVLDASAPSQMNHATMPVINRDLSETSRDSDAAQRRAGPITDDGASSHSPAPAASRQTTPAVQQLLEERRQRLDIDRKQKLEAEKAERKAKEQARRDALNIAPDSARAQQASYAEQQRKRQHEGNLERERILKQIEYDRSLRKEKEEQRKAAAKAQAEQNDDKLKSDETCSTKEPQASPSAQSKNVAVQVRLLDGTTIRKRFPVDQTVRTGVRDWIEQQRPDEKSPYALKMIRTPEPSRTLDISDEEQSLQDLGFAPSANLVMLPIQEYAAAYPVNQNFVFRVFSIGYNTLSTGVDLIVRGVYIFLGFGHGPQAADSDPNSGSTTQPSADNPSVSVRTLGDQQDEPRDQQLYNGNQLNFEPRRDDNKED